MVYQSVSKLFGQYLKCSDLKESSVEFKSRAAGRFINLFGDIDVCQISYPHAEDYRNWLKNLGLKASSVNGYLGNIKPFFSWMVRRGHIKVNPFDGLQQLKVGKLKVKTFAPDEIARILMVADIRWRVLVLLGLCSLRRAEALNLIGKDIYFDKRYILISAKENSANTWEWGIKNWDQGYAILPDVMFGYNFPDLLVTLMDSLPDNQPYVCVTPNYYQRQMRLKAVGKLTYEKRNCPWGNFGRDFRNILRKAKVDTKKTFHNLRASFGTLMANHDVHLEKARVLMRHRSVQTTARYYVQVQEQELVAEANQIVQEHYSTNVP